MKRRDFTLAALLLRFGLAMSPALLCGGCASASADADPQATQVVVPAGGYKLAFNAARDVLREEKFLLERIDSEAGIITTQRTTAAQEPADVITRRQRYVRVTFRPQEATVGQAEETLIDRPVRLSVQVLVERIEAPIWRVPTASVKLSTRTMDPNLVRDEMQPNYAAAAPDDLALAEKLTGLIKRRMSLPNGDGGA